MKKTFRKIHLWLSVPFGLIISIICLTGAALVFEREINDAINSHLYEIEPPENARALDIATIAHRVSEQVDDSLSIMQDRRLREVLITISYPRIC